ncbi:MAG TPA: hypothetical protein VF755_20000 [Catenuloplanes sp.]|jgi:hypothetical protein
MRRIAHAVVGLGALLAGPVVGAAPAAADDDRVRLRMPGSFTAGGSAEQVGMELRRDGDDDCVSVSMRLDVALAGAGDGDVRVAIRDDRRWRALRVARTGAGRFATERIVPDDRRVCGGDRTGVRLLIGLRAGVAADRITLVGRAFTASGGLLDATDRSRAVRRAVVAPRPSGSPAPDTTPSVGAGPQPGADPPSTADPQPGAGAQPSAGPPSTAGPQSSAGAVAQLPPLPPQAPGPQPPARQPVAVTAAPDSGLLTSRTVLMGAGFGLIVLGLAQLAVLLRRNRRRAVDRRGPTRRGAPATQTAGLDPGGGPPPSAWSAGRRGALRFGPAAGVRSALAGLLRRTGSGTATAHQHRPGVERRRTEPDGNRQ